MFRTGIEKLPLLTELIAFMLIEIFFRLMPTNSRLYVCSHSSISSLGRSRARSSVMRGSVAACASASFVYALATKKARWALTALAFADRTMISFLSTFSTRFLHSTTNRER